MKIAVVATGARFEHKKVLAGVAELRRWGLQVSCGRHLFARDIIFAGTLAQRADDMSAALADPSVEAIWIARGGYGAYAVAQELAQRGKPRRPKLLIGHSDATALHLLWNRWGWTSLHASCLDRIGDPASRQERIKLKDIFIEGHREMIGPMTGGNLTLLASSIGTLWELDARGKILFIEEVGERAYRIDRMLTQLSSAGKLRALKGVLLGDFTDCNESDGKRLWPTILHRHFAHAPYPVLKGFPAGHGRRRLPLFFGAPRG